MFEFTHYFDKQPIFDAFGSLPCHVHAITRAWDIDAIVAHYHDRMVRSNRYEKRGFDALADLSNDPCSWGEDCDQDAPDESVSTQVSPARPEEFEDFIVQLGDKEAPAFASFDRQRRGTYRVEFSATTVRAARQLALEFADTFALDEESARKRKPRFGLMVQERGETSVMMVDVEQDRGMDEADLCMHYGDDMVGWESRLKEELTQNSSGLTILRGAPGTGKTSYLSHLVGSLASSHVFLYLPVHAFGMLTSPDVLRFWMTAKHDWTNLAGKPISKVVIIEDAETILCPRDSGCDSQVSDLLNLADGFLSNLLRIHIIATVNTDLKNLDPAVQRRGRLKAFREFQALPFTQARRLAHHLGKSLMENRAHTLAEIYNTSNVIDSPVPDPSNRLPSSLNAADHSSSLLT